MSHEYFFNVLFWSCGHWLSWPKPNSRKGVSKLLHGTKNPVNLHVFMKNSYVQLMLEKVISLNFLKYLAITLIFRSQYDSKGWFKLLMRLIFG